MSEEQLKELQEYNLEYLEAQQSEEIFGGDYTSAVELKYAKKEIERLNNIIDKAIEYIETIVKNTPSSTRKDYANMILIDYKKLLEILEGATGCMNS